MSTASVNYQPNIDSVIDSSKKNSLIIGQEEFVKINVSNRLNDKFEFNVLTKDSIEEGIDLLTQENFQLVVVDIDGLDFEGVNRLYKIINHIQTPCMLIGSDVTFLNRLRVDLDNSFISFLPKAILNTMFNDTVNLLLKKTNSAAKVSKRFMDVSAFEKPLSLYFLAAALILEPLIKVFYLKVQTGFEWDILARTIFSIEGFLGNFEFWALFPLAGYALISVRSWSFFFFIGLQLYSLYAYFSYEKFTWPYVAETPHVSSTLLLFFNVALVLYFLVPANRRPYWNKTRRLWRNTSRYGTNLKGQFKHNNKMVTTTITNISETGAYFTTTKNLPVGHRMMLEVPLGDDVKNLEAIVRRTQNTAHENYYGYGIEFKYKNKQDKIELKEYINSLNHRIQ
jgi:hypothetical protein